MTNAGRVVLFFPSYYSDEAAPPLALIHLAAPLVARGVQVDIVDSAITKDPVGDVLARAEGALCVGVSMVTGPMITEGVTVAKAVRAARPEIPVVAGGWHPSILPEQTLEAPYVDAVVKGQGEITFAEVVELKLAGTTFPCGPANPKFPEKPGAKSSIVINPVPPLINVPGPSSWLKRTL